MAAGCILPLTHKEVDKSMGLRHRAAIGITEASDAIALVISEETGKVSVVDSGNITRIPDKDTLIQLLNNYLLEAEPAKG